MSGREIKFRAWVKPNVNVCRPYMNHRPDFNGDINSIFSENGVNSKNTYGATITYMQFTGLKDCKRTEEFPEGQEIFDGDICRDSKSKLIQIVWSDHHQWGCKIIKGGALSRGLEFPIWQWDKCKENGYRELEVIGNIFENPELLDGKQ